MTELAITETKSFNLQDRIAWLAGVSLVISALCVPTTISGTDFFMTVAVILGILSGQLKTTWLMIKNNPLATLSLAIVILAIVATLWSVAPWSNRLSAVHKYGKLLYIPFLLPLFLDKKWRYRCINAFLIAMFVTVILSIFKYYNLVSIGSNPGVDWVFHSHVETSYFVAFSVFILATRAFENRKLRWFNVLLILLFSYQEFFINEGRTGYIAYAVLLVLFCLQRLSLKGVLLSLVLTVLALFAMYHYSTSFRVRTNSTLHSLQQYQQGQAETSIGFRISFAKFSYHYLKQRPILGYGSGSFRYLYEHSPRIPGWGNRLNTPHDDFLLTAVEFGLVGMLLLIYFYYRQWLMAKRLIDHRFIAEGLILSFVVVSLYNSFLYTAVTGYFYVFFAALLFASYQKRQDKSENA